MNENASDQGTVTGKATANVLGFGVGAALTVGAAFAGAKGIGGLAKGGWKYGKKGVNFTKGKAKDGWDLAKKGYSKASDGLTKAVSNAENGSFGGAVRQLTGMSDDGMVSGRFMEGVKGDSGVPLTPNVKNHKKSHGGGSEIPILDTNPKPQGDPSNIIIPGQSKGGNPKDIITPDNPNPGATPSKIILNNEPSGGDGSIINSDGIRIGGNSTSRTVEAQTRKFDIITNPDGTTLRDEVLANAGKLDSRNPKNIIL